MPKWVNSIVLDNGLNSITSSNTMALISSYTAGNTFAQVTSAVLASVAMSGTDFQKSDGTASSRLLSTVIKSATATSSSGASPDLHIAFYNTAGTVYWVTDETSNQVITSGNTVNFPIITYQSNQPS